MPAILAANMGAWIVPALVIVMLVVIAYGYYTIKGSGIDAHPSGSQDGSTPGADAPSDPGKGRASEGDSGESLGGTFSSHGTK